MRFYKAHDRKACEVFAVSIIDEQINQIWSVELEILDVIHRICTEHGLRYSLAYGTLIGAMRHGGFIPWDDDIDLVMPREDYEKLLAVWHDAAPEGYLLQNTRTDPDFTQNFTKIRKDHTTFLQDDTEREKKYHKGIFVDIFPGDRVAPGKISNLLQHIACAVNLLYTRGYTSGSSGLIGGIERFLLALPKSVHPALRDASENFIRRWNGREELLWFFPSTIGSAKNYYTPKLFENIGTVDFCGGAYACVADPDGFLRVDYGDYMQLPPEEARTWTHHPIVIDFSSNYEELT